MSEKTNEIFIVFKGDAWLTKSSYVMVGTFSTLEKAVEAIIENGVFDEDWLDEQDETDLDYVKEYLLEHRQTPLCGDINYTIETTELNSWKD